MVSRWRKWTSYLDIGEIAQSLRSHVKFKNIVPCRYLANLYKFVWLNYAELRCNLPTFQQTSWNIRRHIPWLFSQLWVRSLCPSDLFIGFLWLPRIEGSYQIKGLCSRLNCFENWQPDSIMRRLNIINCGRNSYNVNPQFLAVFQKYIYVPYQKDSYGPDITKNHSKTPFIFTSRKVHHRKGPSFKSTPDLWELLAKANPGDYMILRCEVSIHIWIYDDICTFVEQYRICTTET